MRKLGATELAVPAIGQGTWQMERDARAEVARTLHRGIDLGLRHIDTAEMYGHGAVESLLGEALGGRRHEVLLASKVVPSNASLAGTQQACERSLRRLRTDHLDLYLLHWPGHHPLEDTIAAFEKLVEAGKIRAWGVSNFDAAELARAHGIAGPGRIACNQVIYHLRERHIEHEIIAWCERHGVTVVGYSPFGSGDFPSSISPGGRVLHEIAQAHGVSARQVALRFLVRRPSCVTIPKASRLDHVVDNAAALSLELSDHELAAIDRAFPPGPPRRGLPMI